MQPWSWQLVAEPASWAHGVGAVPVQVIVPVVQEQPLALLHASCVEYVVQEGGLPAQVPPTPASPGVHVQPSFWHSVW